MDFEALLDAYEKPIFNLIYRLVGDMEEAADLTQETFVAAFKAYGSFRKSSSEYTWLYRIAVNKCKNCFRERERKGLAGYLSLEDDDNTTPEDLLMGHKEEAPHEKIERKELHEKILWAVQTLPVDYKIVFVLRDMHGLSYKEIAETEDLGVDVVRTRLARARGMLRKKLEGYLEK